MARTLEQAAENPPPPPRTLGEHGLTLWNQILTEVEIMDAASREILYQGCAALDRAEQLAERIAGGEKGLFKDELACRAFVTRTLGKLGLIFEPIKPNRRFGSNAY